MVSTRRGPQEPATPEQAQSVHARDARSTTPTNEPTSPSRKRTADGLLVGERRAEKKQLLSIEQDAQDATSAAATVVTEGAAAGKATSVEQDERTEAENQDKHTQDGVAASTSTTTATSTPAASGPRAELQETAGELLKLYACTQSFEYLSAILSRPNTRKGRQYKQLYEKFQRRRRGFRTRDNFIDAASLLEEKNGSGDDAETGDKVSAQRFARCINFVTFAASMLGSRDASFQQLNEHFFDVFIDRTGARSGHLVKLQADILLGLKTQAYIAQAVEKGAVQETLLNELFPSDMTARLAALQPDPANAKLVQSEQTFVKQLIMRKRHLKNRDSPETIAATKDEYKWNDVLRNMLEFLRSHFEEIAQCPSDQLRSMNDDGENDEDVRVEVPAKTESPSTAAAIVRSAQQAAQAGVSAGITRPPSQQLQVSTSPSNGGTAALSVPRSSTGANSASTNPYVVAAQAAAQAAAAASDSVPTPASAQSNTSGLDAADELFKEAMEAANKALEQPPLSDMYAYPQPQANGSRPAAFGMAQTPQQNPHIQQQQFTNSMNSISQASASNPPPFSPANLAAPQVLQAPPPDRQGAVLAPNGQSHPTHQLYEMAREATTGRPAQQQPARRAGSQSQRRPWTQEEEKALLDGLDKVEGPHWSMILQLYGQGGKISEVLKDRNQVQLKDKARNLKLWFLKSGGEVPVNLKGVTGELKTRAPAAIKNQIAQQQQQQQQQQAQSNGMPSPHVQPGHAAMQHKPPTGFEAAHNGVYTQPNLFAQPVPASTMPGFNPSMATAGPSGEVNGVVQSQFQAVSEGHFDIYTAAQEERFRIADEAVEQALRNIAEMENQLPGMGADASIPMVEQPAKTDDSGEPDLLESILGGSPDVEAMDGLEGEDDGGLDLSSLEGMEGVSTTGAEMNAAVAAAME